ncbi:hypothetical protein B1218_34750, partial [Pseudomonas ogarae]
MGGVAGVLTARVTGGGVQRGAVGARGLVLWSEEDGKSWHQAWVSVSGSLTAVWFVDAQIGWAVVHAGGVLATLDGGEHWTLQLAVARVAQLDLDAAKAAQSTAAAA